MRMRRRMIKRSAQILFRSSVFALLLLPLTAHGQEKRAGEARAPAAPNGVDKLDKTSQSSSSAIPPAAPSSLSFEDAVQLALKNNLTTLLARERRKEARGLELESMSGLLPNLAGEVSQSNLSVNLAAQGLTPSAFPLIRSPFIGPFNAFDARV